MSEQDAKKSDANAPNIAGDRLNIFLLTYMYILQCIPRGITDGIAIVLQKRGISYAHQAGFSLISYAYCFKLLWSPIIDCLYCEKIGRRKTWVIPTQFLIGIFLLIISLKLDEWLGSEDGARKPQTGILGIIFFSCVCLASTQDVAVDGWSLTMLKRRNVGHAGTCNNLGYALSQLLSFVLLILLESKDFCNKFRSTPKEYGFVTFSGFTLFWSIVFMVSSTLILIFKKEETRERVEDSVECRLGLKDSYKYLWLITKIRPVRELCLILLTFQIGAAPSNGVARFKLIDAGVTNTNFALMTVPSLPLELVIPFVFGRFIVAKSALRYYIVTYILRLILACFYAVIIFFAPHFKDQDNTFPTWCYWVLFMIYNVDVLTDYFMYVALYAFFSRISDPRFGGMYVTLFSAIASTGYRWPVALCLWIVDLLTIRSCVTVNGRKECVVVLDGFFIETLFCLCFGIVWICVVKKKIYQLEDMDRSVWLVRGKSGGVEKGELREYTANASY